MDIQDKLDQEFVDIVRRMVDLFVEHPTDEQRFKAQAIVAELCNNVMSQTMQHLHPWNSAREQNVKDIGSR